MHKGRVENFGREKKWKMNYKTSVEENDDGFCLQGNHNKSSAPIS